MSIERRLSGSHKADYRPQTVAKLTRAGGCLLLFAIGIAVVTLVSAAGGVAAQENVTADFSYTPSDPVPDERVTFDASGSTTSTTIDEYRWYVDGSRQYNDDSTLTRDFDAYGEYDIRLEVETEGGTTSEQIRTINVGGEGPMASFRYEPSAPVPDERVTFDAAPSGSPHGEIVEYKWYVDGSRQYNDNPTLTYEFDEYGEYDVELYVEDNGGKSDAVIQTVTVDADGPTADFSYEPATPVPDERVTFDASSSLSPEGDIAEYKWYVDGSRQYNDDPTLTYEFDEYGEYDVELFVEDNGGKSDTIIQTVTVDADGPTANFTYDPITPVPDERVTFDASSSLSPEGDIAEYKWYVDGSRQYNDDPTLTYEFDEYGGYDVELFVEDNGGKSDTLIRSVSVAGDGPTADFEYTPSTPAPGERVTFDAGSATSSDGEIVEYKWYVDDSRQYNDDATLTYEFDEYGEYKVELYVEDNGGKSQTQTKTITVDGDGPRANFTISPANPEPSDRVIFDGAVSTAPETEIVAYDWYINGESQYSSDAALSYTFSEFGQYDVELQVEDSGGKTDRIVRTITVGDVADIVDNPEFKLTREGPSTRSVELRPGETGTFRAEIVAESVPVADSRLRVDGDVVADRTVESGTQRFSHEFSSLGEQTVEIEVIGPAGQSATVEWTVRVQGDKPKIESVQPTTQQFNLMTGETQMFSLTAKSDQSPSLDYQWTVDSTPVGSADSLEYTFAEAGLYTVTGSVTDAGGQTVIQTWNVSVSAFRSRPTFASQTTANQLSPGTDSELFTFSIRNPDVNTQDAKIEIITELPNGVSITGAQDVSEGDAGLQALVGTVSPGNQESMRLRLQVTDESLRDEELTIPYQIRYYPSGNPDQYAVFTEERITVTVPSESSPDLGEEAESSQTGDSTPGFTVTIALLALLVLLGIGRYTGR